MDVNVHANELIFDESISTGEIVKKVESPMDKAQAFNDILKSCSDDRKNLTVYIGDSVGDLLCLLQADIGIVAGSSASLRSVGSQFGVSFVPLFPGLVRKQKESDGESSNWNTTVQRERQNGSRDCSRERSRDQQLFFKGKKSI